MDRRPFNVLSLCSGGGGLDLGIRSAVPTARTVCYVEREAFPIAVLEARMQDQLLDAAPIWTDVATFDGKPWRGVVDCIAGGYPCQGFSMAGRRLGADDPRHLWPHIKRIIGEIQPEYCFFENVRGHLSLGFEQVWGDLRRLGYIVKAGLFSAAEVGAPHLRERLYILARRSQVADALHDGQQHEYDAEERRRERLVNAIDQKRRPTPHANCHTGAGTSGREGGENIQTAVQRRWATPTAQCVDMDTMERNSFSREALKEMKDAGTPYQTQTTGMLNPDWVSILQGYPPNWTDLKSDLQE